MRTTSRTFTVPLFLALTLCVGCGGGGNDPVSPPGDVAQDTVPLDGRGGGVLAYTLQPGANGGLHEIHAMNADGSGDRRLIEASIGLNHHDWSPDGRRLTAAGYYTETTSVHTFDADGQNLTRLTNAPGTLDTEPTWSPDGSRIAFTRFYPAQQNRSELWLMNADGTDKHWIGVEGFVGRWSPDGARLIYQSSYDGFTGGQSDIMTCAVDGTDVRTVMETAGNEVTPIWSPDGSQIAFIADYDGDFDLYVMDSDGINVRRLTETDVNDYSPRWSPDGSMIAFDSDSSGSEQWEVFIVGVDGSVEPATPRRAPPLAKWVI